MGVLRWPYQLADVNLSGGNVRERWKIFHGNFNLLPEYPDNVAGTTTLSRNFTDAQGWTPSSCTLSYIGGKMIVTATAENPFIFRAVTAERSVRIKFRMISGAATNSRVANTSGTTYANNKTYDGTGFHDFYIGAGATGSLTIYPGLIGSAAGDIYEIEFIYIGNGNYDSLALDASGNGNHGTVFGCTPVAGITGRALSFDGVNDYVIFNDETIGNGLFAASGRPFTVHFNQVRKSSTLGTMIARAGATGANRTFHIYSSGTSNNANIVLRGTETAITNLATADSITVTWDGTTAKLYVNGDFSQNISVGAAAEEIGQKICLGARTNGTGAFGDKAIYDPRIYNRALGAEEILFMYRFPGIYRALSRYPLQDGFSEMPQDGVIRSATDIGPSKTRQRFTALATYFTAQYDADNNQRQVLDHFYRSVTRGGSLAFEYPHPDGYNVDARFASPPQYTPNNQEYTASVALEVLP